MTYQYSEERLAQGLNSADTTQRKKIKKPVLTLRLLYVFQVETHIYSGELLKKEKKIFKENHSYIHFTTGKLERLRSIKENYILIFDRFTKILL